MKQTNQQPNYVTLFLAANSADIVDMANCAAKAAANMHQAYVNHILAIDAAKVANAAQSGVLEALEKVINTFEIHQSTISRYAETIRVYHEANIKRL